MARLIILGLLSLLSFVTAAEPEIKLDADSFILLQDLPTKNQIPLFENRFRIDEGVEEITLLFFRRPGSASVVLVKPDGSKLHFNTAKNHGISWHDAQNYDLIKIKQPTPGPWQAVGSLLPESRVMVLTEIELVVDPLPQQLMVGETVKVTARLLNGGEPIEAKEFRDVLNLEVIFISTNKPELDNFGQGVVQVAQFRDDGKGYDERARDGVFTGEFQLRFAAGEWTPKYIVRTPLYTREIEQAAVMLAPAPILADIKMSPAINEAISEEIAKPHQITFTITDPAIKAQSILLQGRIRYPNGEIADFSLNEVGGTLRQLKLNNRGHGSYIVEVMAFGTRIDGREFVLNLPEINFMVPLAEVAVSIDPLAAEKQQLNQAAKDEGSFPWLLVIISNAVILLVGVAAIWFVLSDKKLSDLLFWQKKSAHKQAKAQGATGAKNKTADPALKSAAQKTDDIDDILDLTLPDD
ncbi:TIGR03503 family protein [Rheinheimera sp. MMS21-TC3]|uniref:TIGR03503 family protein n=1 Tax=Rheinheimera sp. MMS21-TC3 TaxID=3072790 RepID=UPI0028C4D903|nr:TIGR03503 family protein [Rheinheimera sp. MMS21-TC3]WNO61965.1 TIGR03503 family protein [Rheinheimera sp. MMS21-TC3]